MDRRKLAFLRKLDLERYAKAGRLSRPSLARQVATALAILERLSGDQTGVLLADDVGLGKTSVAAIVAIAFTRATPGTGIRVTVVAPNVTVRQRWKDEIELHLGLLSSTDAGAALPKGKHAGRRLSAAGIRVMTKHHASRKPLANGLVIVDEAHRSKREGAKTLRGRIRQATKRGSQVVLLTATPMSISVLELESILTLVGATDAVPLVKAFVRTLEEAHEAPTGPGDDALRERIKKDADAATAILKKYVVRHGVEDLQAPERSSIGRTRKNLPIPVDAASGEELELLMRTDRILRLGKEHGRTNDPAFHVARRPLFRRLDKVRTKAAISPAVRRHLDAVQQLGLREQVHPKLSAVCAAIAPIIERGEKVVVFAHHHDVAIEVSEHLSKAFGSRPETRPNSGTWEEAWAALLRRHRRGAKPKNRKEQEEGAEIDPAEQQFAKWMAAPEVTTQLSARIGAGRQRTVEGIVELLCRKRIGGTRETYAEAAIRLFESVTRDPSSSAFAMLRKVANGHLPGLGSHRVLSLHPLPEHTNQHRYDLAIELFNSPFGPDVAVATDRFAEAIDLHRYCRHLIHYELDHSPMRTIQREGRVRRVGSWAGRTAPGEVCYAMPYFPGTRDEVLVRIMEARIRAFRLLLGGAPPILENELDAAGSDMDGLLEPIERALRSFSRRLTVRVRKR